MRTIAIILAVSASPLRESTAEENRAAEGTNAVVISSELINRLVAEARTNNPSVKAAEARAHAAGLNAEGVRTWEDPMATFGGSVFSDRGFDPAEEGDLIYGVEQKLPLWQRPKLARGVAQAESAMREAELRYRVEQLRSEVTKALLSAAFAQQTVDIGEQNLGWLRSTAQAAENKFRAGQGSIADTLQAQNEVAKRNDMLRTDRLRLGHEHFTLNRLLNRKADAGWPLLILPAVAPAIPLSQKLLNLAQDNEPRLKILEQGIRQATANAELTRKSRLPDVSFGVEGKQYHGDGGFRMGMFSLRFTLPWLNGDKYRKDYERERQKARSAHEEREDQALMVREELHHLLVEVEAMRREALLYADEITPRANQALTSRVADWEAGHGAFRDVLDARRMLLESQLMTARATAEEHARLAEVLLWTGLERLDELLPLVNEVPLLPEHETHHGQP